MGKVLFSIFAKKIYFLFLLILKSFASLQQSAQNIDIVTVFNSYFVFYTILKFCLWRYCNFIKNLFLYILYFILLW